MSQRTERMAGEVRAVLGEILAREEIKDPRVRGIGLITVTHVRVTGDLQHARALFTVHGMHPSELARVRDGLNHAGGYFRRALGQRLRTRVSPEVTFEVDHVFEQAAHVEQLLSEIARESAAAAAPAEPAPAEAAPTGEPGDDDE